MPESKVNEAVNNASKASKHEAIQERLHIGRWNDTTEVWVETALKQPDYIIKDVISPGLGIVSGEPGSLKTTLAYDWIITIGSGAETWLGQEVREESRGKHVLLIDKDNDPPLINRRMAVQAQHRGCADVALPRIMHISPEYMLASEIDGLSLTTAVLRWLEGLPMPEGESAAIRVGLIVLDTLPSLSGVESENDSAEMQKAMTNLRILSRELDCPAIMLTHPSKIGVGAVRAQLEQGHAPDLESLVRGSSGVGGVASLAVAATKMERKVDDNGNEVSPLRVRIGISKRRDGPGGQVFDVLCESSTQTFVTTDSDWVDLTALVMTRLVVVEALRSQSKIQEFLQYMREHQAAEFTTTAWERAKKEDETIPASRTVLDYFRRDRETCQNAGISAEIRKP